MNGNALNLRSLFEEINEIGSSGFDVSDLMSALEEVRTTPEPEAEKKKKIKKIREMVEGVRRSSRLAEVAARKMAAANLNMGAAAPAYPNRGLDWGGEGVPVYGTNYSVIRGPNENGHNKSSRPSRRSKAPARTRDRRNYGNNERRSRTNELSTGYGNNRRNTRRRNNHNKNRNIPESEKRETPRHTSILEKAQVVIDTQNERLTNNATKRVYQIKGYENKLALLKKFRREYPGNVNIEVINEAIEILERKLGISRPMEPAAVMPKNRGATAAAAAATVPTPKKERTFYTRQLKPIIEKYMAKGEIDKAVPFIQLLSTRTDRTPADDALLSQYSQYIPNYQASQADIDLLESLTSSIAGLSMGPAAPPSTNFSNL
jgi:hypothetical protein